MSFVGSGLCGLQKTINLIGPLLVFIVWMSMLIIHSPKVRASNGINSILATMVIKVVAHRAHGNKFSYQLKLSLHCLSL